MFSLLLAQIEAKDAGTWVAVITVAGSAVLKIISEIAKRRTRLDEAELLREEKLEKSKDDYIERIDRLYLQLRDDYLALQNKYDATVLRYDKEIDDLQAELRTAYQTAYRLKEISEQQKKESRKREGDITN